MSKNKFKKRKDRKRLIRAEMVKRGILSKEIAARLGISEPAVSQGCATSPRIVAALIEAGVPERVFGKTSPPSPPPGPKPGKIVFWDETNGAKACGGVK